MHQNSKAWRVPLKTQWMLLSRWLLQVASWVQRGSRAPPWLLLAKVRQAPGKTSPACAAAPLCESCLNHCRRWISVTSPWEILGRVVHLCSRQVGKQPRGCISPSSLGLQLYLGGKGGQKTKSTGRRWWRALVKSGTGFWTKPWLNSAPSSSQDPKQQEFWLNSGCWHPVLHDHSLL